MGLSCRLQYMGKTPGKKSATSRKVIERLSSQKLVTGHGDDMRFKSPTDGKWYDINEADMAHITDAVKWWNRKGRYYGAKSKTVREFMLNEENYILEHFSYNRSQGAKLPDRYLPPEDLSDHR